MRRLGLILCFLALAFVAGGLTVMWWRAPKEPALPDAPTVLVQVREVAKLETLEVTLYRKVSFAPDPTPSDSFFGDLVAWARASLAPKRGKAIVFARLHTGLSFSELDERHLSIHGSTVELVLPKVQTQVELLPGEMEVIDSNLTSEQTAQLLELARSGFEREAEANTDLKEHARRSAEQALRGLLMTLGFRKVVFVDRLPTFPAGAG